MINGIGSGAGYYTPLFSTNSTGGVAGNGASGLAQTQQKLFGAIDGDGDGSISRSELTGFLNKTAAAAGGSGDQTQAANSLFARMSAGSGSISLRQFESNAGALVSQLKSELASADSSTGTSAANSALLANLKQVAQTLAAGSAASIAGAQHGTAAQGVGDTGGHNHHGRAGHGHAGGGSLISQFMQQYQSAGATSGMTAGSSVSTSA